ncbi:MAG TPA: hypothetical protein VKR21_16015 [Solirubrobacteraceae bacterium]|nr:hypothetical protein [Solirubrobacteraceae bacterium]
MADEDPRDVLRSIAYGKDPRIAPGDRVRAIERLVELEADDRRGERFEELTPGQVREELESLHAMTLSALAVMDGPDAVKPPRNADTDHSFRDAGERVRENNSARVGQLYDELRELRSICRDGFAELFGEDEPDAEAVIRAWRKVHTPEPEGEAVEEPRGLPSGE